jgi:hypothetical protein
MSSLRENRFFCSISFVTQEDFYKSSFLQLYDRTEQYSDTKTVINSLSNLQDGHQKCRRVILNLKIMPNAYDVIRVYTSNIEVGTQTFYNYINEQLCKDNKETLCHLMPLIRRATYQINRNASSSECIAYQGMN